MRLKKALKKRTYKPSRKEINEYLKWVRRKFPCRTILAMVDERMLDYVDFDWEEDGFESEYDWYIEHSNKEAENDIINMIVDELEKKFKVSFDYDSYYNIAHMIADKCGVSI